MARKSRSHDIMPHVGETFSRTYLFTKQNIADCASRCGDENPIHYDEERAAASRFGGIIASGPHSTAVFMAMVATHLSRKHEMAGLEFAIRFEKAIPAETSTTMAWTVTGAEPHAKLGGTLVTLEGRVTDATGRTFLSARGSAIVWANSVDGIPRVASGP